MVNSDKATSDDAIGFKRHAEVTADVLWQQEQASTTSRSKIVAAVEGNWGQGKSSYMRMMQAWLKHNQLRTVWVSVWHHKENGTLWAETTRDILTQLRDESDIAQSATALGKRLWALSKQYAAWLWRALPAITLLIVFPIAVLLLSAFLFMDHSLYCNARSITQGYSTNSVALGGGVFSVFLLLIWKLCSDLHSHPLISALRKAYKHNDGQASGPTLRTFRQRLLQAILPYTSKEKPVFIFIDDLDRIGPAEAGEVLWTLNQLFDEHLPAVFVVGIDRDKVASGLGCKYSDVLPYLHDNHFKQAEPLNGDDNERTSDGNGDQIKADKRRAVRYGHEFLEKVFNIRTEVPHIHDTQQQDFVKALTSTTKEPADEPTFWQSKPIPDNHKVNVDDLLRSTTFFNALKNNPRRIKQVSNELHLWWAQLSAYGALAEDDKTSTYTQQRLAKIILLRLQWPVFYLDLQREPKVLAPLALSIEYNMEEEPPTDWFTGRQRIVYERCKNRLDDELLGVLARNTERNIIINVEELVDRDKILKERAFDEHSLAGLDFDALLRVPQPAEKPIHAVDKATESLATKEPDADVALVEPDTISAQEAREPATSRDEQTANTPPDTRSDQPTPLELPKTPLEIEIGRCERQLLRIAKSAGQDSIEYAGALGQLGFAYLENAALEQARNALEQATHLYAKTVGNRHSDYTNAINDLGITLHCQGNLAEAKQRFEQILEIYKTILNDRSGNTGIILTNISFVLRDQGKFQDAKEHCEQALELFRALGERKKLDEAVVLSKLALVLHDQGKAQEAKQRIDEVEEILKAGKALYDNRHRNLGIVNHITGTILTEQRNWNEARRSLERARSIFTDAYGQKYWRVAETDGWLSVLGWASKAPNTDPVKSCGEALGRLLNTLGPRNRFAVVRLSRKLLEMGGDPVQIARDQLSEEDAQALRELLEPDTN